MRTAIVTEVMNASVTIRFLTRLAGAATAAALLAAGSAHAATACPGSDLVPEAGNTAQVRSATICLINARRAEYGVRPLRASAPLRDAAQPFAEAMVRGHFFSHTGADGSTPTDRVSRTAYLRGARSWGAAEDIAFGTPAMASPSAVVDHWMSSAPHRANILNTRMRDIGIGVADATPDGRSGATYVADFGFRVR